MVTLHTVAGESKSLGQDYQICKSLYETLALE